MSLSRGVQKIEKVLQVEKNRLMEDFFNVVKVLEKHDSIPEHLES